MPHLLQNMNPCFFIKSLSYNLGIDVSCTLRPTMAVKGREEMESLHNLYLALLMQLGLQKQNSVWSL